MAGGLVVAAWYLRRRRLPLAQVLDAAAPGLLLGVAIAAAGALLAGRNPGAPSEVPWAIVLWGVRRHPSQVYEALAVLGALGMALAVLGTPAATRDGRTYLAGRVRAQSLAGGAVSGGECAPRRRISARAGRGAGGGARRALVVGAEGGNPDPR